MGLGKNVALLVAASVISFLDFYNLQIMIYSKHFILE